MVDRERTGRSGGAKKGGADPSDDKDFGLAKRARGILGQLLSESPVDSLVERVGDIAMRNKAEEAGVRIAEGFIKVPALRPILIALPTGILQVVSQLLADYLMTKYYPDHDRPREWAKEFAQGFSRRIDEMQSGGPRTAPAAGTTPAVPAGPREMTAAEVLTKHPEIVTIIDVGLSSMNPTVQQLAAEVQADIHQHLNYAHEGVTLSALPPLPAPPFDAALAGLPIRQNVVAFVEANCPAAERPALYEDLRKRITGLHQLAELLAPFPAAAPAASAPIVLAAISDQVVWLRGAYPDPATLSAVLRRLAPHVADDDRKAFLFSAPADAGLPAAVSTSAAWSEFTTTVVDAAPDEALALINEAEARVATVLQAQGLTAPPAGTAQLTPAQLRLRILALPKRTVALTTPDFEQRLATLEIVHPAPTAVAPPLTLTDVRARLAALPERKGELTLDLLKSRMQLIKDVGASRSVAAFAGRTGKLLGQLGADIAGTVTGDITNGIRNLKI